MDMLTKSDDQNTDTCEVIYDLRVPAQTLTLYQF